MILKNAVESVSQELLLVNPASGPCVRLAPFDFKSLVHYSCTK